jgi:hypothetical protein
MREKGTLYPVKREEWCLVPEVGRRELDATKNGKSKTSVLPKCLLRPFDDFGAEFSACAKFCMRKFKHD